MPRKQTWQPSFDFSAPSAETPETPAPIKPVNGTNGTNGHVARVNARRGQPLNLFDFNFTAEEPEPETPPQDDLSTAPINLTGQTDRPENTRKPIYPQIAATPLAKGKDVLAAIRTLKAVESENRCASDEERQTLANFGGFGALAKLIFPDDVLLKKEPNHKYRGYPSASWQAMGEELRKLLTPQEYDSAKRTTFNAFYTSPTVIAAMHQALSRLGVPANATILEPGCSVGNFMAYAPPEARFIGVELDSVSGRIAKALHPNQEIRIESFQDSRLPQIDAAIGNVPFADIPFRYNGHTFSLHDFCLAKSVDALKSHGVAALITSHFTLDKVNADIREYLGERADFLGAIRLPCDAFKREGTPAVTDIIFLRKRSPGEPARHEEAEWQRSRPFEIEGAEVSVNRYFVRHPEMVLGDWTRENTMYGDEGFSVTSNGDLAEQLKEAVERLPTFTPPERVSNSTPLEDTDVTRDSAKPPSHLTEGSFYIDDNGAIRQVVDGQGEQVEYSGIKMSAYGHTMTEKRMTALIRIKEQARRVLQSQNDAWPETEREAERRTLRSLHDRFEAAYGPINKTTFSEAGDGTIRRMPNIVKFREDPDAMLVLSLEEYDETTGKATKAAIFSRDVVGTKKEILHVTSAEEGLLVSLNQHGKVDLAFISQLYGKAEKEIIAELGDLIYLDPESNTFQTADEYLSGNVRHKLAVAEATGDSRNADALRKVQPEDVLPGDIDAGLGAPWIPEDDIHAFAVDLFRVAPDDIQVGHIKADAAWAIQPTWSAKNSVAAMTEFGTDRANGTWLLELALNMKAPTIYDTMPDDTKVINQEATLAAREKQKQIKETFKGWIFADADRTERLVRIYNDNFNSIRPRLFDGSHLTFPGMNEALQLRQHQKDGAWRIMSSGNTLLAHEVGAGKTGCMAAAGMKMRQTGLVKKPMYVVMNHMLEQFAREFQQWYPNAKLLVATKEDFTKDRRKHLTAKIATGDWDAIIVTHSSFERIGMSRDYQEKFLRQQIAEFNDLIIETAAIKGADRNLIKNIEKQKAAREEKLKDLMAEEKKDTGLVFDELGVDHIFIDEIQEHKNLEAATKMQRIAGIPTGGSERAFDLWMKTQYLHEKHPGHGLTGATGTPISNSLVEMYTLQRYFDPEGLKSRGIDHLDAWAGCFGEVVEQMEISPDGRTLKPRSRFSHFSNLPELQQLFRSFADVQTEDDLKLPKPKIHGGKPQVVACQMSPEQMELQDELVERYERLRNTRIDPRIDNALKITTDGQKLAIDPRLLCATASDFEESKLNSVVKNTARIWRETAAQRSTQMIFCDMGVNPTPWQFCFYESLINKLVNAGIPREQIATVGEADTDAKKHVLFQKVNMGQVRVIIGSTKKMGAGTNAQKKLIAKHDIDAPWRPADIQQRDGRIARQGNENAVVQIFRYVTEGSFDAYRWQALETKARFIAQIITGKNTLRRAEDVGSQELTFAEVKAIASGNPAVLTLAEADAELHRLGVLKRSHADEQYIARKRLKELPGYIESQKARVAGLMKDADTIKGQSDIMIGGNRVMREDIIGVLGGALESMPALVNAARKVPLGTYRGLRFGMVLHPHFAPETYLEGETTCRDTLHREHHGARAVLNSLERLAKQYSSEVEIARQNLTLAENQLRDFQGRHGLEFAHETYTRELTELRDQLKAGLSANPPEGTPPTAEVAEKIKALKASNTVDAPAAPRAERKIDAEEPVTRKILRQMQEEPDTLTTPETITQPDQPRRI